MARTSLFRVPETHTLRLDVLVDEAGDGGTEGLLLLRPDPDQIPTKKPLAVSLGLDIDRAIAGVEEADAAARLSSSLNFREEGVTHQSGFWRETGEVSYFSRGGRHAVKRTWRHVESAAPRPVPVQTRIPRLYKVDVCDTPENYERAKLRQQGLLYERQVYAP